MVLHYVDVSTERVRRATSEDNKFQRELKARFDLIIINRPQYYRWRHHLFMTSYNVFISRNAFMLPYVQMQLKIAAYLFRPVQADYSDMFSHSLTPKHPHC